MLSSKGSITVSVNIGKGDTEIAAWFNMLRESGQSKSMWASAILLAYEKGELLDLGSISIESAEALRKRRKASALAGGSALMYGTGNISSRPRRLDAGWGNRGPNGEYIIGSTITVRLSNREAVKEYWKLREEGYHISTLLKDVIRQGLSRGDAPFPPDPAQAAAWLHQPQIKQLRPSKKDAPPQTARTAASIEERREDVVGTTRFSGGDIEQNISKPNPLLQYI